MQDIDFSSLAEETLDTFAEIANTAGSKLSEGQAAGTDSFATGNTLTGSKAYQNLDGIQRGQRDGEIMPRAGYRPTGTGR